MLWWEGPGSGHILAEKLLVKEERELIRQKWGWGDEKEHLDRWGAINTLYVSFSSKRDRESNVF